jgi:3-oxoacyl-(acyl-carrier-protein) synthase
MIYLADYRYAASTFTEVIEDNPYPQRVHWFPETYTKSKSGMFYPAHELAAKVLDKVLIEHVHNNPVPGKTGFILAAGSQGWAGIRGRHDNKDDGRLHYKLKLPLLTLTNIYAGRTASMFGAMDYVSTDASACASSLKVLLEVHNLMTNFGFDRMIVLGVEDAVNNSTLEFFGQAKASLLYKEEVAGAKPSAFDSKNAGFNIGQGAGLAIFESERVAKNPKAQLLGTYTAAEDFSNPLGQRPDGQGYRRAIEGALHMAKLSPSEVGIIKTHGTGTPTNNTAEKTAITSIFNEFVATSYKQFVGHTLAASGLMETGMVLDDIRKGVLPAIPNRTEDDPKFLSNSSPVSDGPVLCLAAGMGNVFSAAIFNSRM